MRVKFMVAVSVIVAVSVSGCSLGGGDDEETSGGIFALGSLNSPDTLNPWKAQEGSSNTIMSLVYPQLVQYEHPGDDYKLVGDWAESWEFSEDRKSLTFDLRSGTEWSDGEPMTADDAAWTINTTIENKEGPTATLTPAVAGIEKAEAVDDETLVIHFKRPTGNSLGNLQQFWILPKHVWEPETAGNPDALNTFLPENQTEFVGGGPYVLKSWEKNGQIVLAKNPTFYGPESNVDAISRSFYTGPDAMLAALQSGELDAVDQVPASFARKIEESPDSGIVLETVPGTTISDLAWNSNPDKPNNRELLDPEVKRAISMCIDTQEIVDTIFGGLAQPIGSIIVPQSNSANPAIGPIPHDCESANTLLDSLGYERGSDGIRVVPAADGEPEHEMSYTVLTFADEGDINVNAMFTMVQQQVKELGVELNQKVPGDIAATATFAVGDDCDYDSRKGYTSYDAWFDDWAANIFDPTFLLSLMTTSAWCTLSDTGYANPGYDALNDRLNQALDQEDQQTIVNEMTQILSDELPQTMIAQLDAVRAHRSDWTGFDPDLAPGFVISKRYFTDIRPE